MENEHKYDILCFTWFHQIVEKDTATSSVVSNSPGASAMGANTSYTS